MSDPLTYKSAGVDIAAGNDLVDQIKPLAQRTTRPGSMSGLGGFGAVFDIKAAGFEDPLLISATDGVGTKLKLAIAHNIHHSVGIDLVAMCVNDLIVQGAEPLFFLDYYASGALDVAQARDIIAGISLACEQSGCALSGGETAELPGLYADGDYDLAGFCVGAVERDQLITGGQVKAGDVILGLASNGIHSNGFSLVRKILDKTGIQLSDTPPYLAAAADKTPERFIDILMQPTRLYVKPVLAALKQGGIHAMAHITGGGLIENLPRCLPAGTKAVLDAEKWQAPDLFKWLAQSGPVPAEDMLLTFNCGIGYCLIVDANQVDQVKKILVDQGETVYSIGEVIGDDAEKPSCEIKNSAKMF